MGMDSIYHPYRTLEDLSTGEDIKNEHTDVANNGDEGDKKSENEDQYDVEENGEKPTRTYRYI